MYSTHFLYCLITLIVEDLSAYAYFFIEKKVGAEMMCTPKTGRI